MAKFLSTEWMSELTSRLNAHEAFTSAIGSVELVLQFEVSDPPEGTEGTYHIAIADGAAEVVPGAAEAPDATIGNDYATAVALSKGELNTQMAFMTGKLKVSGNMAKLMMNQAMLTQFTAASEGMDVTYD